MGHELSDEDVLDEFILILKSVVFELTEKQDNEGCLSEEESKHLQSCEKRLSKLDRLFRVGIISIPAISGLLGGATGLLRHGGSEESRGPLFRKGVWQWGGISRRFDASCLMVDGSENRKRIPPGGMDQDS